MLGNADIHTYISVNLIVEGTVIMSYDIIYTKVLKYKYWMNVHTLVLDANGLANHSLTQAAVLIIIL